MISPNLVHSSPLIGTFINGKIKQPISIGISNGTLNAEYEPIILPRIYLSRGIEFENTSRSVPRSFSPFTALYVNSIAKRESII